LVMVTDGVFFGVGEHGAIVAQRPECRAGQGDSNCCPWRTPAMLRVLPAATDDAA
jgi:hypothetical protein